MSNLAGYPSAIISGPPGKSGRIQGLEFVLPPPVFSPLDISDIVFWLDADVNVTTISNDVSLWGDRSTEGNDVSQSTAGNRPFYDTAGPRPFVNFDGADEHLVGANFSGGNESQPNTYFLVCQKKTAIVNDTLMDGLNGDDRNAIFMNGGDWAQFAGSVSQYQVADTNLNVLVPIFDSGSSKFYVNGGVSDPSLNPGPDFIGGVTVGARFTGSGSDFNFFDLIMYGRRLNNTEIDQVGQFLADKNGLTWTDVT